MGGGSGCELEKLHEWPGWPLRSFQDFIRFATNSESDTLEVGLLGFIIFLRGDQAWGSDASQDLKMLADKTEP